MMNEVGEESILECEVCSTETNVEDMMVTHDDRHVCLDCHITCERCDELHGSDDTMHEVEGIYIYCEDCTSSYAYYCDSCEGYTTQGTCRLADRREYWCSDCLDRAYFCDECDQYWAEGCDNGCNSEEDENERVIHDYNYRPDAVFHATDKNERLFFGIEIEVEAGRNRDESALYAQQLESKDLAYLKQDGSLNNGFEVVTHPMSHDFYKNEAQEFWDVIEGLRTEYKVKSWGTQTCGLHIPVSRTGFASGSHMHRFLNLIYSNQELYETLAGRSSEQWAKFTDIVNTEWIYDAEGNRDYINGKTTRSFRRKLSHYNNSDRYSAVNTLNQETLELRIFKGTVNGHTIKAHLDLAHASVEYTRVMSVPQVRDGALNPHNFVKYITANEQLYPELVERLSKVWKSSSASRQEVSI